MKPENIWAVNAHNQERADMDICKLCGEYKLDTLPCDCQAANVSDSLGFALLADTEVVLYKEGEPCNHKGCKYHMKHDCEGC